MAFSYDIMHSCWSPVPKCRPSFQQLVVQLEALWLGLSPPPRSKEPLLYVNLEGEEQEVDRYTGRAQGPQELLSWGVPWQQEEEEEEVRPWLTGESGAAQASGGDYRYIINPSGEEEGGAGTQSVDTMDDDDDDVVIHV